MKRRECWDTGRLTGAGWQFVFDVHIGGGKGLYLWLAVGRRYFWIKLLRGAMGSYR